MEERREKRREKEEKRRELNRMAIAAAESIPDPKTPQGGGAKKKRTKKSTKTDHSNDMLNGAKELDAAALAELAKDPNDANNDDGDLLSDASEDKDHDQHVRDNFLDHNDSDNESSDDDDDEDDDDEARFALKLRDLQRPLEAWGVTLTGKLTLGEPQHDTATNTHAAHRLNHNTDNNNDISLSNQDVNMDADANSIMGNSTTGGPSNADAVSVTSKRSKSKHDQGSVSGKSASGNTNKSGMDATAK